MDFYFKEQNNGNKQCVATKTWYFNSQRDYIRTWVFASRHSSDPHVHSPKYILELVKQFQIIRLIGIAKLLLGNEKSNANGWNYYLDGDHMSGQLQVFSAQSYQL